MEKALKIGNILIAQLFICIFLVPIWTDYTHQAELKLYIDIYTLDLYYLMYILCVLNYGTTPAVDPRMFHLWLIVIIISILHSFVTIFAYNWGKKNVRIKFFRDLLKTWLGLNWWWEPPWLTYVLAIKVNIFVQEPNYLWPKSIVTLPLCVRTWNPCLKTLQSSEVLSSQVNSHKKKEQSS